MVRKVAWVVSFSAVISSASRGGIVLFAPEEVVVDRGTTVPGPMEVAVAVLKSSLSPPAESVDLLFGSDDVSITGFYCGSNLPKTPDHWSVSHGPFGVYPAELFVQFSRDVVPLPPLFNGTLMFDLTGLPNGDYAIMVNSERDGGLSGKYERGIVEPLSGSLPIRIVPEPATALFLMLGALGVIPSAVRRRSPRRYFGPEK